ncbi:hypothetical protein LPJ66_005971 [Kickxella alabastrina]|uniref:Uncharacterized protein n=1 Tax=Kickxella alabastrina TaxID=61397 RepID=A0ACC1IFD6_9FUNG|nr:hypothetical protein LPJ66_005971 [Kickxella alabastrina]
MDILDFVEAHKFKLQEQGQDQAQDQGQGMGHGQAPRQPMSPPGAYSAGPASPSGMTTIMVPSSKVGLIIGRGGESIRDIQQSSGARVQVQPDNGRGAPERPIQLIGLPDQIEYARVRIMEIVNSERPAGIGGGSNGVAPGGYQQRQEYAPQNQAQGFGAPRHAQQQSYGMPPPQQQQQDRYGGAAGPMASAMQSMAPPAHVEEMQIPAEAVGIVIGRGGESIKLLQQTSGARIQIIQGQDRSAPFKPVTISGDHAACMRARRMIEEKVDSLQERAPVAAGFAGGRSTQYGTAPSSGYDQPQRRSAHSYSGGSYAQQQQPSAAVGGVYSGYASEQPQQFYGAQQAQSQQAQQQINAAPAAQYAASGYQQTGYQPQAQAQAQTQGQAQVSGDQQATQWTNQQTADYYSQYASTSPEYAQYAEYYRKLAEKDPNGIVPSDN